MLTIHADSRGRALVVQGEWITAAGPLEEVRAAHPRARVREWPGILSPGLVNLYGNELLEEAYHPDPREADELGTEPLTGEALAALALDDARWGASARRGVQRMPKPWAIRANAAP
ncbi:imidazolonepropionase-like domain-containing protein, partial [Streptomyces sp. NPDC003487]